MSDKECLAIVLYFFLTGRAEAEFGNGSLNNAVASFLCGWFMIPVRLIVRIVR